MNQTEQIFTKCPSCGKKLKQGDIYCKRCKRLSPDIPHSTETYLRLGNMAAKQSKGLKKLIWTRTILLIVSLVMLFLVLSDVFPMQRDEIKDIYFPEYTESIRLYKKCKVNITDTVELCTIETSSYNKQTFTKFGSYETVYFLFTDVNGASGIVSSSDPDKIMTLRRLGKFAEEEAEFYAKKVAVPTNIQPSVDGINYSLFSEYEEYFDEETRQEIAEQKEEINDYKKIFTAFNNLDVDDIETTYTEQHFAYGFVILIAAVIGVLVFFILKPFVIMKKNKITRLSDYMTIIQQSL